MIVNWWGNMVATNNTVSDSTDDTSTASTSNQRFYPSFKPLNAEPSREKHSYPKKRNYPVENKFHESAHHRKRQILGAG